MGITSAAFLGQGGFVMDSLPRMPMVVQAASALQVRITFVPTKVGVTHDTLVITTDDSSQTPIRISLRGKGVSK